IVAERAVMRAHCLARLYAAMTRNRLLAGDCESADHSLALGLAMGARHGTCATCDALLLPVAVSVRVTQRDLAAAEGFCCQLEAAATQYASHLWVAMARQARAELEAARGDRDVALACYAEAHTAYTNALNAYEAACCLVAAAELRRARGSPGDAETATIEQAEAQRVFELLGIYTAQ